MHDNPPTINENELRKLVPLDLTLVDIIENAFVALFDGSAVMPPVLSIELLSAHGEVDVKTAWIKGLDSFAVKISTGFFDNPKLGFPSLGGLMILLSAKTGHVDALLTDNGLLTDLRTAAAGAVVARAFSRRDAKVATVLGTGVQARLQLQAAALVRPIESAIIWGRDRNKAVQMAQEIEQTMHIEAEVCDRIKDAVAGSDLVITTTPSRKPLITKDMLHEGLHITAIGSDQPGKTEIAPTALSSADRLFCDHVEQSRALGELFAANAAGISYDDLEATELGAVLAGAKMGRRSDVEITICDLTGTGVQDTAIASLAYERWKSSAASSGHQT